CIENYESEDEEDAEENDNAIVPDAHDAGTAAANDADPDVPADAVPKAKKFKFDTPKGRADGTNTFHWKIWGDGADKKGFLQSKMILHAFAYHLACLEAIPGGYVWLEAHPKGALLLAMQSVNGDYVNPGKRANFFSEDNLGDTVVREGNKNKLVRHATKSLSTIEKWDDDHWKDLIDTVKEYIETPGRKRARTTSRSGSEAGDDVIVSDDDGVMVLSD
ncbi:hypothetical protein B0H10DRAFT_2080287, partial [Mycena sp. CBHHK59/15]